MRNSRGKRTGVHRAAAFVGAAMVVGCVAARASAEDDTPEPIKRKSMPALDDLIKTGVEQLLDMQEKEGAWPYEGVYRVGGDIPVGYRIGGTSLTCGALLLAVPKDAKAATAIDRGVQFILKNLDDPLMKPSRKDTYDVRVWGHCCALDLFCRLRAAGRLGERKGEIEAWITKLVQALVTEELKQGGWNYANRQAPATFVTGPVTQTLLLARSQGEDVPTEVFERARRVLEKARLESGTFLYSGEAKDENRKDDGKQLPGSIARSAVCESTLMLLGGGSTKAVQASLDAFHQHWEWLEKRRKQNGTHVKPYMIAPYYFYYGHRYAAQAIQMLPAEARAKERERLLEKILRTRDPDGTWNDRVFKRSRNFGTTMVVLALLGDMTPVPPTLAEAEKTTIRKRPAGPAAEASKPDEKKPAATEPAD